MGVGVRPWPFIPPPPPLISDDLTLGAAKYAERFGKPTINQQWLLREHAEAERNKARRLDWETRFKVLGPRPVDQG